MKSKKTGLPLPFLTIVARVDSDLIAETDKDGWADVRLIWDGHRYTIERKQP